MTDQQPFATAIKTALDAALPASVEAYDIDDVPGTNGNPGTLPAKYVEITVSRRWVPERRFSGEVTLPGGRLTTRYCAASVQDARELRSRVSAALEDVALSLDGGDTLGPFAFETEAEPIDRANVGFTGADDWTF